MKVKKAVIPAAGLGTRFLPATKAMPKEMLPIVDTPTIQYIVEEAVKSGIEDIIIVTGRTKRSVEDHFDKAYELETELEKSGKTDFLKVVQDISEMANIHYVRQREALGLGHAVYCAKTFVGNDPFAVLLGDDIVKAEKPCLAQMIEVFNEKQASVLGVQTVPHEHICKYGAIDATPEGERTYRVHDMVEKPKPEEAPSDIAVLGRYILTPEIFECIERTPRGKGGEIQLTDAIELLGKQQPIYAYDFVGRRYDVGDRMGYLEAMVEYALDRADLKDRFAAYLKEITSKL